MYFFTRWTNESLQNKTNSISQKLAGLKIHIQGTEEKAKIYYDHAREDIDRLIQYYLEQLNVPYQISLKNTLLAEYETLINRLTVLIQNKNRDKFNQFPGLTGNILEINYRQHGITTIFWISLLFVFSSIALLIQSVTSLANPFIGIPLLLATVFVSFNLWNNAKQWQEHHHYKQEENRLSKIIRYSLLMNLKNAHYLEQNPNYVPEPLAFDYRQFQHHSGLLRAAVL